MRIIFMPPASEKRSLSFAEIMVAWRLLEWLEHNTGRQPE